MLDRVKSIQTKLVEFWNRFTSKQKTLIITITAAVIFTLVALIVLLNRTKYVELVTFDNTSDAASADQVLTDAGIEHQVSGNGLTFTVDEKSESAARLTLGENNIATNADDDWDKLFNNSMSTTDSERAAYIDFRALSIIYGLMAGMKGLQKLRVFRNIERTLLR